MITPMQMYWITRLNAIEGLGVTAIVISIAVAVIGISFELAMMDIGSSVSLLMLRKIIKWVLIFALPGILTVVLVPTTKEMAAIIVVPKIANSEKVQAAGNKLYDLAVEWMEELKPNSKRETK